MTKAKWVLGLFFALFLVTPAFADKDSKFSFVLLENGLTENRHSVGPDEMLAADVPLVSTRTGKRVGTQHFEVLENLPASGFSPFGFVSNLVYDFGNGSSITVDDFALWCNLINAEPVPEPEFPGAFVVIVCNGEGEITRGTKAFKNVGGTLTRRIQLFEATDIDGSQFDKGFSFFEIDKQERQRWR